MNSPMRMLRRIEAGDVLQRHSLALTGLFKLKEIELDAPDEAGNSRTVAKSNQTQKLNSSKSFGDVDTLVWEIVLARKWQNQTGSTVLDESQTASVLTQPLQKEGKPKHK